MLYIDSICREFDIWSDISSAVCIRADISELDKAKLFTKEISKKVLLHRYLIEYDFIARHQDLDRDSVILSLSLKSKDGDRIRNVKTTTPSMKFLATEKEDDETVLMGSLVSRAETRSHIPRSEMGCAPMFPDRKRRSEELESGDEDEDGVEGGDEDEDEDGYASRTVSLQPVRKAARRVW